MLVKKHWHDFEIGDVLFWRLYDSLREVKVIYTGINNISVVDIHSKAPQQHPVRIWEHELEQLTKENPFK